MREIELVDPFTSIARRRLSVGSATMSRQGIRGNQPGTSMRPVFCLSVLPGNARNVCDFFIYIYLFALLHRYVLSYPCKFRPNVPAPLPTLRSFAAISREIYSGFAAPVYRRVQKVLLPRAASRCYFAFAAENCPAQSSLR